MPEIRKPIPPRVEFKDIEPCFKEILHKLWERKILYADATQADLRWALAAVRKQKNNNTNKKKKNE